MADELPVLIAAVTTAIARELESAAQGGQDVWIALERDAVHEGMHVLEVYTAEMDAPLRLLAEPLGTTSEQGSALRLHPWPETGGRASRRAKPKPRTSLAGGRFELVSLLGQGSIGAVYLARHTGLNRTVAVKTLHEAFQKDPDFCGRFYAEALAMSRLNHANLINVHDFGQEPDGLLYIAMAYVEGKTLREIQQAAAGAAGAFDLRRIVAWMLQIGAGLGHAHSRGLIHRDVKPDNVMVVVSEDDDGQRVETIKILDFGFAVPPSVSGEVAQRLAGTPVYMSPEQCRGEELDARSDLYACGVMMYELATGTVPFFAPDAKTLCQMHIDAPVPLVASKRPDVDPRFERMVQRALSKNREDRQANMTELRAELKALLMPMTASANQVSDPAAPSARAVPQLVVPTPAPFSVQRQPDPSPTPPRAAAPDDDWLERGTGYDVERAKPERALAERLAGDATTWLGELSRERNPRAFQRRVEELEGAVKVLAERADAVTLSRVSVVVGGLVEGGGRDEASQDALAAVVRLFTNPLVLFPVARMFLERGPDAQREAATKLLARAGIAGALALYDARTKLPPAGMPVGRVTFVTTMKSLGPSARPVVRAALERIYEQRGSAELAEDVLLSVPNGEDDTTAELVMRYVTSKAPNVARAATRALPRVAGMRARSVLLRVIQHEDDGVSVAAVVGLHELDAVDREAVAVIAAQVHAGRVRTAQMQKVIMTALQSATASAQSEADALLARLR